MDLICASICYRGWAEDEVEATLKFAPAIGYRFMEIHGPLTWSLEAVDQFDLPKLTKNLQASGISCAGLYTPGWGGQDDQDARQHARAIARCVQFAEALGGDHVTSTGASPRAEQGALRRVMLCVEEVLRMTPTTSPVRLALEPHFGNVLEQLEDFDRILQAFPDPRLGVCVDTGHLHSAGVDIPEFIHRFGPRVYSVHLKDHLGEVSVGIGRGEINLKAVVDALLAIQYKGGLTVELEVKDPQNLPVYTEEAYFYLSGLLGQKLEDRKPGQNRPG
jgi:sugar phosphate isomerase/epimerase